MNGANFAESGAFGFVSDRDASEIGKGRKMLTATHFESVTNKTVVVGIDSGGNDRVIGVKSLDDNRGVIKVATPNATDDLGEELKSALGGGIVGK